MNRKERRFYRDAEENLGRNYEKKEFHEYGHDMRKSVRVRKSAPNYDDWMRDQGWVRNFDGFWERRDGRYWEKIQYYEKYREWKIEFTTERGQRGCECKAKSREKDWNRYERGYDSNKMKLQKKSVPDRASSSNESKFHSLNNSSHVMKKRSFSAVRLSQFDKRGDITSQKDQARASSKTSFKKRSLSPQSGSKLANKRISRGDNAITMENQANISENSPDSAVPSQNIRKSLNSRFSSLRLNSETPFPAVNMMNMEITLANKLKNDNRGRKETPMPKDSLEHRRMRRLEKDDKYLPSDEIEESLTTDEGKETTEDTTDNDDSSKASEFNASDLDESMKNIKLSEGVDILNSAHGYSQEVLGEEEPHLPRRQDSDMIDLNVSQDLFEAAKADVTEDLEEYKAKSDIASKDEEFGRKHQDVKKIELKVANIERQISELRAQLVNVN